MSAARALLLRRCLFTYLLQKPSDAQLSTTMMMIDDVDARSTYLHLNWIVAQRFRGFVVLRQPERVSQAVRHTVCHQSALHRTGMEATPSPSPSLTLGPIQYPERAYIIIMKAI
jgi:hypothetical protein